MEDNKLGQIPHGFEGQDQKKQRGEIGLKLLWICWEKFKGEMGNKNWGKTIAGFEGEIG